MKIRTSKRFGIWYHLITLILVFGILNLVTPRTSAGDNPPASKDAPPTQNSVILVCIVGGAIIIGGIIVAVKLKRYCDKHLPPTPPPPPPTTNTPPRVPTQQKMSYSAAGVPTFEMGTNSMEEYDISDYGYMDPNGALYETWTILHLDMSTNGSPFFNLPITGYVSSANVLLQVGTNVSLTPRVPGQSLEFDAPVGACDKSMLLRFAAP